MSSSATLARVVVIVNEQQARTWIRTRAASLNEMLKPIEPGYGGSAGGKRLIAGNDLSSQPCVGEIRHPTPRTNTYTKRTSWPGRKQSSKVS